VSPKRLPVTLDHREVVALLESLRTWRDRAIAGLMVFCPDFDTGFA
jgi:hypothetical protein